MNGTFSFVYSGATGVGMGVFKIIDSFLIGIDFGGARYKGTASADPETGEIDLSLQMSVPAGLALVQSTSPQDVPYTKSLAGKVAYEFNDGKPFELFVAPGQVILMVRRIPDDYAWIADGFKITLEPLPPA